MKNGADIEYILGVPYYSAEKAAAELGHSKSNLLHHARLKHIKSIPHKGGKYFRMEWMQAFVEWKVAHS